MQTNKERLLEITYEIYSKDRIISFEQFFDKIVNEEEFDFEFQELWKKAKEIDRERRTGKA